MCVAVDGVAGFSKLVKILHGLTPCRSVPTAAGVVADVLVKTGHENEGRRYATDKDRVLGE